MELQNRLKARLADSKREAERNAGKEGKEKVGKILTPEYSPLPTNFLTPNPCVSCAFICK